MANICTGAIHIRGVRKSVEDFVDIISTRMVLYVDLNDEAAPDEIITYKSSFECKWSFYSAVMTHPIVYQDEVFSFTDLARKLKIDFEVWSYEPGIGFSEHYIYLPESEYWLDEEYHYSEIYLEDFESYEDAVQAFPDVTEDEYANGWAEVREVEETWEL